MSSPAEKKSGVVSEVTPLAVPERSAIASSKANARAVRVRRVRHLVARLVAFVLLPTVLSGVYYGALASDQFESFALFTVQSSESRPGFSFEGALAGFATGLGSSGHDALSVRDYVLSRDMLGRLDKEHAFIAHFKDPHRDFLARLPRQASFEEAYEYFGHKVYADYDQTSGAVTLRVRAFDAAKAAELARSILKYSEEMVNKLSERERRDRTAYAEADVKKAEARLVNARTAIITLQQKHGDFNPEATATSAMEVRTQLEGELAKARAEVMQLKAFMKEDAPQVLAANERAKSLAAQIAGESRRLVDPKRSTGLNTSFADFEAAMVEKEFAQKAYESTLANLELARADADRQHRYLAVVASPSTPDESTYPRRARSVLTVFLLSFLLLGVGSLMLAAVREHARL